MMRPQIIKMMGVMSLRASFLQNVQGDPPLTGQLIISIRKDTHKLHVVPTNSRTGHGLGTTPCSACYSCEMQVSLINWPMMPLTSSLFSSSFRSSNTVSNMERRFKSDH